MCLYTLRGLDVAQAVEHSVVQVWILLHGGIDPAWKMHFQFGLFSIPTSGPQLVHQRLWYVLSCLWESVYPLLLIRKGSLCADSGIPLKKYVTMAICLMSNS